MSDASDEAIARVNDRIADRAAETRAELAAIGCLELAEACKGRFGARLAYLKTPRVERGDSSLMRPGCVWTVYQKPKDRGTVTNERASTKGRTKSSTWGDIHGG